MIGDRAEFVAHVRNYMRPKSLGGGSSCARCIALDWLARQGFVPSWEWVAACAVMFALRTVLCVVRVWRFLAPGGMRNHVFVCLEANIGAGKTTALRTVAHAMRFREGVQVEEEPLDPVWMWILKRTHRRERAHLWQLNMQLYVAAKYCWMQEFCVRPHTKLLLTERSPLSSLLVFARHGLSSRPREVDLVVEVFLTTATLPHFVVFLACRDPMQWITLRGRSEESGVTEEFVQAIESLHASMHSFLVRSGMYSDFQVLRTTRESAVSDIINMIDMV